MLTKTLLHTLLATLAIRPGFSLPVGEQMSTTAFPSLAGPGPFQDFAAQLEDDKAPGDSAMDSDLKSKVENFEVVNVQKGVITQSKVQELETKMHNFLHRTKQKIKDVFDDDDDDDKNPDDQFGRRDSSAEGPFVEAATFIGDVQNNSQGAQNLLFRGPLLSIEVFPGEYALRGIKIKNISGNETIFGLASTAPKVKSPGRFTFDDKERLTSLTIHTADGGKTVSGIEFATDKKHTYSAICKHQGHHPVQRKIGSGMIGQVRAVVGKSGKEKDAQSAILALGIDMIDEIESIKMVEVKYEGFDNAGQRPPEKGESLIAGAQILDNRNSTVQQSFMFTLSKAISKSYSFMLQGMGQVGLDLGMSSEISVPIIKAVKGNVSVMTHWTLAITAAATFTYTATVSQGAMFTVQCPPGKFCEAESVFNTYRLDTKYNGRFEIVTKSGAKFEWWRSGQFKAADVTDLRLVVNQYDSEPRSSAAAAAR